MKYKDLNLKKIREDNDLDFAHFTYQKGMCSCCYGPRNLPKRYWRGGVVPECDNYTYLLFNNADNGSGIVKGTDEICCHSYDSIEWDFPIEKLENVCRDLQKQLGEEYVVLVPATHSRCILVCKKDHPIIERELEIGEYKTVQND